MKRILLPVFSASVLIMASCNSNGGGFSLETPKTAEQLKAELKTKEQQSPAKYMNVSNTTFKQNLVREAGFFHGAEYDGYNLEGTINNTASVAQYKDVVITVQYFSQTNTMVSQDNFTIYEFFPPNSSRHFKMKLNPPEVMKSFSASVRSATATY